MAAVNCAKLEAALAPVLADVYRYEGGDLPTFLAKQVEYLVDSEHAGFEEPLEDHVTMVLWNTFPGGTTAKKAAARVMAAYQA